MALLFLLLKKYEKCFFRSIIQGDSWIIMSPTELRMQPTIQLDELYVPNVLWVAFSIPSGSLLLMKL
jgi:hypothetical protein